MLMLVQLWLWCGTDTGRAVPLFDKPNLASVLLANTYGVCGVDRGGIGALSSFPVLGTLGVELMRLIRLFV